MTLQEHVSLDERWREMMAQGRDLATRELFTFALEAARQGSHGPEIAQALAMAEDAQDRDESSPTYGNFVWYLRNERPEDLNAVDFCMRHGALLWLHHREDLLPQARERLERLLRYGAEGVRRHEVSVSYTNIWVMNTWCRISLGEGLGLAELAEDGYRRLDQWLDYTRQAGIHEYISPTYYPASMEPMEFIAQYASRPQGREKADRALRLFWTDIAANWFPPCQRLGGAHSRDYDHLWGRNRRGIMRQMVEDALAAAPEQYLPGPDLPREMKGLLDQVPRLVRQRWGEAPWETAAHYVGHRFSVGSAGASYGPIDKPLTVNVAGGPETPMMALHVDARGDPYGANLIDSGGGGHMKALHLVPFLASVQRGPEALLIAAPKPEGRHYFRSAPDPQCLLVHLSIPLEARVWWTDVPMDLRGGGPTRVRIPANTPVFVQLGDVVVGVRFPFTRDTQGHPAPVELIRDEQGLALGAMHLTCTLSEGPAQAGGVAALWLRAAEGLDEGGLAAFRREMSRPVRVQVDGDVISLTVGETPLHLVVDVAKEERLVVQGAEKGAGEGLLAVNGRELGRAILGR